MKKILIIEDDPAISKGLVDTLSLENFETKTVDDGEEGYKTAKAEKFDLILLDLMLPVKYGIDICKDLRKDGINTPIVMLTSKQEEIDKVLGLELGADDYVTKPFSPKVLVARIRAVLRRKSELVPEIEECTFGNIYVNFKSYNAAKKGKELELSTLEYKVLKYFCQRENEVIERSVLLDEVWGYESFPTTRTVDNFILSLRKKIEDDPSKPKHLLTVHGAGYKFLK